MIKIPHFYLSHALFLLSNLFCLFLVFCYGFRMDWCAAITVFPVWVWITPAMILVTLQVIIDKRETAFFSFALWSAFLFVYDDHPAALVRGFVYQWDQTKLEQYQQNGNGLRIITFNTLGHDIETLKQLKTLKPDILCIQESPQPALLQQIGDEIFDGFTSVVRGGDCSIITNGKITQNEIPSTHRFYLPVTIQLPSGFTVVVVSLHFYPPVVCFNLFSSSCWQDQTTNRIRRREQMRILREHIDTIPKDIPIIVAGDYNAPSGDELYRQLQPRLSDAYPIAGIGWGDSFHNEYPVVRIDQVWISNHFQPTALITHSSQSSDHRVVICDLILK